MTIETLHSCPRCAALSEKVAKLERELAVRQRDGEIGALMSAFDIGATNARLLYALYRGGGRVVSHQTLRSLIAGDSHSNAVKVHVFRLKAALGEDAIEPYRGIGYGLTMHGMSRCLAALEPPEMQRVAG